METNPQALKFKEEYARLREINSLYKAINETNQQVKDNQKRLDFIDRNRSERQAELNSLEEKIKNLTVSMSENSGLITSYTSRLTRIEENILSVKTDKELQSLEHEKSDLKTKLTVLESTLFSQMEDEEKASLEIEACRNFLSGSLESRKEAETEVNAENQKHKEVIESHLMRIKSINDELMSMTQAHLSNALKHNPDFRFMSFIKQGNCTACGIQIDSMTARSIESFKEVSTCSMCRRILLPEHL